MRYRAAAGDGACAAGTALRRALASRGNVLVVAGTRAMDELDPTGFLTRDMADPCPPYRPSRRRGEVVD